ncbi:dicarboxylate/amino acid:cation symporter [Candidatus Riflebacteria bacterium]
MDDKTPKTVPAVQRPDQKPEGDSILWQIVIGIVLGVIAAYLFESKCSEIAFIGEIFLTLLKMIVVPLVITSLICGITSMGDISKSSGIGSVAVIYFMLTTAISVTLGIAIVVTVQPGVGKGAIIKASEAQLKRATSKFSAKKKAVDPKFQQKDMASKMKAAWGFIRDFISHRAIPKNIFKSAVNNEILPLIFFALVFGIALISMGEKTRPLIDFFECLNEVILFLVNKIILLAPIGIFAIVANKLGNALGKGEFIKTLMILKSYIFCVLFGLCIHFFFVLPLLLVLITKRNAFTFYRGVGKALLNAFSTASSSATLPLTMQGCEENNGINAKSCRFVLPLGATINMDGTALYEAVAVIFMAQLAGITLEPVQLLIVFITATLAAIGAAGIPEAGLVTMVMVIQAVNLPDEAVSNALALILVVDWFLDRCRTTVNVAGDSVGAAIVETLCLTEVSEGDNQAV